MKIYALSGLGADARVFDHLHITCDLIPIPWIVPKEKESLKNYSIRLSQKIDAHGNFGILGVSFGGLVAIEMSKILKPKITILISSIEDHNAMPRAYQAIGKLGFLHHLPSVLFIPPKIIAKWLFRAKNYTLLYDIVKDTDPHFAKWATIQLVNWKNKRTLNNPLLNIKGGKDLLFPPSNKKADIKIIDGGGHFMIVDKADEIKRLIDFKLSTLNT